MNALTYGAQLMVSGVLRYDRALQVGDEVVLVTTKGEAIALAIAQMTSAVLATVENGIVAKLKRVVLERDTYPRRWGLGPHAQAKKALVASGKLDKHGRPTADTPLDWIKGYQYFDPKTGQQFTPKVGASVPAPAAAAPAPTTPSAASASSDKPATPGDKRPREEAKDSAAKKTEEERKREKAEKKERKALKKEKKKQKQAEKEKQEEKKE